MGQISINILEKEVVATGDGVFNSISTSSDECYSTFIFEVLTTTSCWIDTNSAPGLWVIQKLTGNGIWVNGETLTENTTYKVTLPGFRSPNQTLNTTRYTVLLALRPDEFGFFLDSKSCNRYGTNLLCPAPVI